MRVAMLWVLSVSCTGGEVAEGPVETLAPTPSAHEQRDMLVIGEQTDIGHLIPIVYESSTDAEILGAINLQIVDSEFDCSLKKRPGLATSYVWNATGDVITLGLRNDIQWSDGRPVTAHDVAFTFELMADPVVASPRYNFLVNMKEGLRPKVVDDWTLEFHFTHAYDRDTMLSHATSIPPIPKHVLETADRATLRGHPLDKAPLVTGPWKLAKWEPNERIVLEPNEHFTGPPEMQPHLKRVVLRILPEYSTRLLELEKGTVDMVSGINIADADRLRKTHPHLRMARRGYRFSDYIAWNLSNPLFQDLDVRKALAMAVDADGIIGKLLTAESGERYARRMVGTITPELCGVHNDDIALLPFDLDGAKALMAQSGWRDSDQDGVLDKDGKRFEFTLVTNAGNKRRADIQIFVQDQLKQLGVKVNLEQVETNAFWDDLRKRDYEAALAGWSASLFVDPVDVWHSDTPEMKHEFNFTGYANPEVDALMEKALTVPLLGDAAPLWKDMQAKIYADQPYLFLWWQDEITAVDSRFEDTHIDVLGRLHNLHTWKVAPDKVKYEK